MVSKAVPNDTDKPQYDRQQILPRRLHHVLLEGVLSSDLAKCCCTFGIAPA
jgi:hypothetical protein